MLPLRSGVNAGLLHPAAKPLVFCLALLPLGWLVALAVLDGLGANPAEALIRGLGDWALRLLCATLALTPLRVSAGLTALARYRRMLGLFAAFYALLHLLAYAWLDQGLDGAALVRDVVKRPFITVGMLTGLVLAVLAATSPQRAVRWLGGRRWQALHRSVYAAALLALLHFAWLRAGKNNFAEVLWYALVLGALLAWRLVRALQRAQRTRQSAQAL
ncbi:sulfite oxidase heme-binding subunit YedZ [Comamonas granuli]|uniref:sulfite oxidase heme-binding subunit YedZ n=1 Tax=Comamonas granuli TaxID=290309 RepID=UPI0005AB446A|nr:protein-methionine-sulfoxide reductase heme-binding subunit MsrQ [Comamonas granuli]